MLGGVASGSLVNSRWVGSGYGRWHCRWIGGTFSDSRKCLTYIMLEENPLFHAAAVWMLRESPVDYKAPLTGSYTVILTVGDICICNR